MTLTDLLFFPMCTMTLSACEASLVSSFSLSLPLTRCENSRPSTFCSLLTEVTWVQSSSNTGSNGLPPSWRGGDGGDGCDGSDIDPPLSCAMFRAGEEKRSGNSTWAEQAPETSLADDVLRCTSFSVLIKTPLPPSLVFLDWSLSHVLDLGTEVAFPTLE